MKILPPDPDPDQSAIDKCGGISIRISIRRQMLSLLREGNVIAEFQVSTSRYGIGSEPGSFKTPLGRFRVCEKFGDDAPVGSVFVGRKPTGEISAEGGDDDFVLTRILWLDGCEEQNCNSKDRYIYVHGTNQENQIGTPASHGCIRMRANDLIEVYSQVATGTPVEIVA